MSLRLDPVLVASRSADTDGRLVFVGEFLAAVLVRLSDAHEDDAGKWFLDAGFGPVHDVIRPPIFADLDEAKAWIGERLAQQPWT